LVLLCLSLLWLGLICPTSPAAAPAPPATVPCALDGVASYYTPLVHLRKLHLVRPDLIPFPIEYDVYC
jgi:hypothetical protein